MKNEWLYNLGGRCRSKWRIAKLALTGSGLANYNKWKEVKLSSKNQSFTKFRGRGAEVIGVDQIVIFGTYTPTLTLIEDEREEPPSLSVTHSATSLKYNENMDSSCRVFKNKLYAIPMN